MIPKYIHYCWFGYGEKSSSFAKNIASWKKYYPDFEIIEWNETNSFIESSAYAQEAYQCEKYSFVADYVRLKALVEYGGIYLDTDVEVLKRDQALENMDFVAGFEASDRIGTAILFSRQAEPLIEKWLRLYDNRHFIQKNGIIDMTPNVHELTELLKQDGWKMDNSEQHIDHRLLLPRDKLYPYSIGDRKISLDKALMVHWCEGSWVSGKLKLKHGFIRFIKMILGKKLYDNLRNRFFAGQV